jgi:hypothetical protein
MVRDTLLSDLSVYSASLRYLYLAWAIFSRARFTLLDQFYVNHESINQHIENWPICGVKGRPRSSFGNLSAIVSARRIATLQSFHNCRTASHRNSKNGGRGTHPSHQQTLPCMILCFELRAAQPSVSAENRPIVESEVFVVAIGLSFIVSRFSRFTIRLQDPINGINSRNHREHGCIHSSEVIRSCGVNIVVR